MPRALMTSKGQLTVPQSVRKELRLVVGDTVDFHKNEAGEMVIEPVRGDIRALRGIFKYNGPHVTDEQMNEAIGDAIVERYLRSFE